MYILLIIKRFFSEEGHILYISPSLNEVDSVTCFVQWNLEAAQSQCLSFLVCFCTFSALSLYSSFQFSNSRCWSEILLCLDWAQQHLCLHGWSSSVWHAGSHLQLWVCVQIRRQVFNDNRISIGRFNSFISPTHKTSIVLVLAGIFLSNQISLKTLENCYLSVNVIKMILQFFIIWAIKIQHLNQSLYK